MSLSLLLSVSFEVGIVVHAYTWLKEGLPRVQGQPGLKRNHV